MDPATGAQTLVTQGGQLCYPFGIAVHPSGSVLVTDYGDFSDGTTVINCTHDFGALVKVDPVTKGQSILSRNAAQWGNLLRNPLGVTVEAGGRILLVNQNGGTAPRRRRGKMRPVKVSKMHRLADLFFAAVSPVGFVASPAIALPMAPVLAFGWPGVALLDGR